MTENSNYSVAAIIFNRKTCLCEVYFSTNKSGTNFIETKKNKFFVTKFIFGFNEEMFRLSKNDFHTRYVSKG